MRIRALSLLAGLAAVLSLAAAPAALAAAGGTTASPKAASMFPPLRTVAVRGIGSHGQPFRGMFGIQRYIARGGKVFAVGTLTGTLKHRHITRSDVMIPAKLTGSSATTAAATNCSILHLVLGPVKLNLLGLKVTLGGGPKANLPIVLDITAVPGPGNLLGNLLCGLTNALNGTGVLTALDTQLGQLAATLTSLTSLLGQLPA